MIFEVTPEHIEALSDSDLRTLVGYLAEQEAVQAGQSAAGVTYGGHQNAKDGGIDVRVDLGKTAIKGYIPRAQTGFQVKAEDMPEGKIKDEMCPDNKLRPSIVELGEAGGAYIIVSSKGTVSDTFLSKRRNAMAKAIADAPTASGLHLDFYDRRRLATWVNQHPGLIPWIRSRVGIPLSGWRPYEDWSSSPGAIDEKYLIDDHVRIVSARLKETDGLKAIAGIEKLREVLAQPKGSVRLVGLSGVGKTRLTQALFDDTVGSNTLSPRLAVYTDLADSPDPIPLELLSYLQHPGKRCILIVDNCGVELHRKLTARMRLAQGNVSVITIEYDISDDEPENTDTFMLEPASSEMIQNIIKRRYPNLESPEIRTIASFSEGNSRIALALADTAQHGESLANLKDSILIKRLFHQNHQENPALLRAAKACSLVYSFDGETLNGTEAELPRLAELAGQTVSEFHGHVAELYRRKLVQKRSKWRALLPHALAHKLAKDALQDFPLDQIRKELVEGAPARFLKSYSRRLGCLHDSPEAQDIVSSWLDSTGWLVEIETLDDVGLTVLDNVAPVNPEAVLTAIEVAIQRMPEAFKADPCRRRTISLLRSFAYDVGSFDKAMSFIGALATEITLSNNTDEAINVFKSLFYLYLSGTLAPVKQRTNLLCKIAKSGKPHSTELVMSALDAMLECTHFSSSYGFEFGTRKRNFGYHPKTHGEIRDWYSEVFKLASDLSGYASLRDPVRNMIASQFRFLAREAGSIDQLIALADSFANDGEWPEGWAGVRTAVRDATKAECKDEANKLQVLADRLKPKTLAERISSHVLPEQYGALDIAEIDFDDDKRYEKAHKLIEDVCESIGKELSDDLPTFKLHLPKLLESSSTRVRKVACCIGRATKHPRPFWDAIVAEVTDPSYNWRVYSFPSSFLLGLSEVSKPLSETLLDEVLNNPALHPFFVNMQASVGVDTLGSKRIIKAIKLPSIPIHMFSTLGHGGASDNLPTQNFKEMMMAIAACDGGLAIALDILYMRLFSRLSDKKPVEIEDKETGRALLGLLAFEKRQNKESHILTKIVRECLVSPIDDTLVEKLCERLLAGIVQWKVSALDYEELVAEIGATFPCVLLNIFVERASNEREDRRSVFETFRRNRTCPLRKVSDDILLEWANERPESRFHQIAEILRPWKPTDDKGSNDNSSDDSASSIQWTPAALRILHEAPEPLKILNQYIDKFRPSGWGGSLSDILKTRVPLLEELTQDTETSIAEAATKALTSFKEDIIRAQESEAMDSRERDERFEW
jgi:hypothetical protein